MVLPHYSIAVSMNCTFGHVRLMAVLKVNRILQESGWKEFPIDFLISDFPWGIILQGLTTPVTVATLFSNIKPPNDSTLVRL